MYPDIDPTKKNSRPYTGIVAVQLGVGVMNLLVHGVLVSHDSVLGLSLERVQDHAQGLDFTVHEARIEVRDLKVSANPATSLQDELHHLLSLVPHAIRLILEELVESHSIDTVRVEVTGLKEES